MNKTKIRFMTIFALLAALALVLGIAGGALFVRKSALAVDYRPTEIFSAGTGGTVGSSEEEGDKYVQFTFSDDEGSVHFRRDLALKWFAPTEEGYAANYFSLTFAFPSFGFSRLSLSFESAEENVSKEGTSINTLVFFYEENALKAAVRDASA